MKTLHICSILHDISNGPSHSIPAMVSALNDDENSADLLNLTHHRTDPNIVANYPFQYKIYESFSYSQMKQYSLVVFHNFWEKAFVPLSLYCNLNRIPYVITPRGSLTRNALKRKKIKKALFSLPYLLFLYRAKALHFLTENEKAVSLFFGKTNFIIPNGINLPASDTTCNISSLGYKRILFLGRLDPYTKGLDTLIQAISEIRELVTENGFIFELFGSDVPRGGKAKLLKMIEDYKLYDIVKVHDAVFGKEKDHTIRTSTYFILPSRFEGHPMSAIECLSYGLPGIVTQETNIAKEIQEYSCGFSINNNETLAGILSKAILNKNVESLTTGAISLCRSEFSWHKLSKKIYDYYFELL